MKRLIEYHLDEHIIFIEVDSDVSDFERVGRERDQISRAETHFREVLNSIRPITEALFDAVKSANQPNDVQFEFGLKFGAKAGIILASADSEATFKVLLKWENSK